MKLMKSLIASALVLAGSSAFAAPQISSLVAHTGASKSTEALRWSSVCVANLDLEGAVDAQYTYGEVTDESTWQDLKVEPNTIWRLSQQFSTAGGPAKLTIHFRSIAADEASVLSYELAGTQTILEPFRCDRLENWKFEKTDDDTGAIDLTHVE
jgi:hypothetical protein